MTVPLEERIRRESLHGHAILRTKESNWGWHTAAGAIRKDRRSRFLCESSGSIANGGRVLEVGCGTGTFTGELSKAYPNLTSIDVSEVLLQHAAKTFPAVRFEKQDIHRTGFADASFDLIVGCSVLHHLEWDVALKEMYRILRPGGALRFSEPNLANPQIFLQKNWPWLKRLMGDSPDESAFTPRQIEHSLRSIGYVRISAEPYEFLHPSTPPALIPAVTRVERLLEQTLLVSLAGSIRVVANRP